MSGVTDEMIEVATKTFWQWHGEGHAAAQRALLAAVYPLIRDQVRKQALEDAAKLVEPKQPRPCDCETCYCANRDDAATVVAWDADTATAATIREMEDQSDGR